MSQLIALAMLPSALTAHQLRSLVSIFPVSFAWKSEKFLSSRVEHEPPASTRS